MTVISEELKEKIQAEGTVRTVSVIGPDGRPHVFFRRSVHVGENGEIDFYEIAETSEENRSLVYSIWNDKPVAIGILTAEGESFEIEGEVSRAIVAGAEYEEAYRHVREQGFRDLAAIWRIEPVRIRESTVTKIAEKEQKEHPLFLHLDSIARKERS